MAHASESGRFYDPVTLQAVYEVPNASKPGEMRRPTIKDAVKNGWVSSVTTILALLSDFGLEKWKQQQVLMAALTMPKPPEISDEDYIEAIISDANRQGVEAADLGTRIHAQIQGAYSGELWNPEYEVYVMAVFEAMRKEFGSISWEAEKAFVHVLNFAGKADLISWTPEIVVDFKTTSLSGKKLEKAGYPKHKLQLAAYRLGFGMKQGSLVNVYISTSKPGEVFIKIYSEQEAIHATSKWLALLEYYKLDKNMEE